VEKLAFYHPKCGHFGDGEFYSYIVDDLQWASEDVMYDLTHKLEDEVFWDVGYISEILEEYELEE
jgi:hypothetical protein